MTLPETNNKQLPDSLKEAEDLDKNDNDKDIDDNEVQIKTRL